MNHKKAMPAKGTRFSARVTVPGPVPDHSCASGENSATEIRRRIRVVVRRTEKRIPAMAVARGA